MKQPILVKLKMKGIYKSLLSCLGFLIIAVSFVGVMYFFYDKVALHDSDIEVNGALSINYVDGKSFNIDNENKKVIEFSVSNASDTTNYYNIIFKQVRGNGTYALFYDDTLIMDGELKSTNEITSRYISIDASETKNYTLEINNNSNSFLKGILEIRNQYNKKITFADTILNNVIPSTDTLTKVGSEASLEDEGLIKSSDDLGVSYYFRGNVQNNYVSFANMTWRIVRINGDNTVRLILDNTTDVLASYYTSSKKNMEFVESNIYTYLENWYNTNLKDYTSYITNSKFCNDIEHDENNNYLAYARIITNKIPTLNCLGQSVSNNIGLLTIDEVMLAGASPNQNNTSFYLYNTNVKNAWYTLSGASGDNDSLNLFMIGTNGNLIMNTNGDLYRDIRPVINLIKNIEVTGTGTKEDPYVCQM